MTARNAMTVSGGLWATAFAALGLGALLSTSDSRSVVCLAMVVHALNILAIATERPGTREHSRPLATRYTVVALGVALAGEAIGWAVLLGTGERELALWFALGMSFAVAGIAATLRRVPADGAFACQIFFHGTFLCPLLAATLAAMFSSSLVQRDGERTMLASATSLSVLVVRTVWIPLVFVTLLAVLAVGSSRTGRDRALAWDVLAAGQAAFVVIVFRWAAHGL